MYQEINILGLTRESSETINMDLKKIMKAFESFKKQNIFITPFLKAHIFKIALGFLNPTTLMYLMGSLYNSQMIGIQISLMQNLIG